MTIVITAKFKNMNYEMIPVLLQVRRRGACNSGGGPELLGASIYSRMSVLDSGGL